MERSDIQPLMSGLEEIDRRLQRPVQSLMGVVRNNLERIKAPTGRYRFPPFVSESMSPPPAQPLTHAVCCATLQRLWNVRRRIGWLEKAFEDDDRGLMAVAKASQGDRLKVPQALADPFYLPQAGDRKALLALLSNNDFGPLDPYTASQVFWVLLHAGERRLHSPVGFLAFFSMVWALKRRFPDPVAAGVSLAGQVPTAWITAKCVVPLATLSKICRRRAKLFRRLQEHLGELKKLEKMKSPAVARKQPFALEAIAQDLRDISSITIDKERFEQAAKKIEESLDAQGLDEQGGEREVAALFTTALDEVREALIKLGEGTEDALGPVAKIVNDDEGEATLVSELLGALDCAAEGDRGRAIRGVLGRSLPAPPFSKATEREFWLAHRDAARTASELTIDCFLRLRKVKDNLTRKNLEYGRTVSTKVGRLDSALKIVIEANRDIASRVRQALDDPSAWCLRVMTEQIAYASSKSWTHFDPAELVSSLYVAATQGKVQGDPSVRDAIEKALVGHRGDGSWVAGQPFFSAGDTGVSPPTSEIAWMLAETLAGRPSITSADEELSKYIEWLGRTQKSVDKSDAAGSTSVEGWVSERNLGERVDLWATAFAINALLGIRDLLEFRLWEHCERRFKVLPAGRPLREIDPVDLDFPHSERLHRKLSRMARETDGDRYKEATYSLILHGPPGSSKTAVIEALAGEMWQEARRRSGRDARLIRITPADFTRRGEDRLDSEAALIFDTLGRIRGVTILFDEIDDLLQKRGPREGLRFMDLVVPAMLNRLQDLRDVCPRQEVAFLLATNYVEKIERALIRKGRIDAAVPVVYPDRTSREWIVDRHVAKLAESTSGDEISLEASRFLGEYCRGEWLARLDRWPWKDLDELFKDIGAAVFASKRRQESDDQIRRTVDEKVESYQRRIPPSPYEDDMRKAALQTSPELAREFGFHLLSASSTRKDFGTAAGPDLRADVIESLWQECR